MNDPNAFWKWFIHAHHKFEHVQGDRKESLLDELQDRLQKFSPGLWFEVGGHPDGPMELIISAEGNPDYFAEVLALVGCAPKMEGWQFIAFKPPQGFEFVTEYEGVTINPAKSWFLPLVSESNPSALGLRVAVPGFSQELEKIYGAAVCIVLDTGLGELAASESIHHLEVVALPGDPEGEGYIELNELGDYLAWRAARPPVV
jgi:hypothetical protein